MLNLGVMTNLGFCNQSNIYIYIYIYLYLCVCAFLSCRICKYWGASVGFDSHGSHNQGKGVGLIQGLLQGIREFCVCCTGGFWIRGAWFGILKLGDMPGNDLIPKRHNRACVTDDLTKAVVEVVLV